MTKINGPFQYSDKDRTLRQTGIDVVESSIIAPCGFVIRFYAHDSLNIFYYFVPEALK